MSELTKEQKLQDQVIVLKARLFDYQDQAEAIQAQSKVFVEALGQIAKTVGLEGEEIQVADIVKAVEALVPAQGELEVEAK